MRRNEIATGYFTSLVKDYNLEYQGIYRDKNGQLYAIDYADYMGGGLDVLFTIDTMPELES